MLWLIGYGPDVFEFSDSFLTVKLPYNPLVVNESTELVGGVNGGVNGGINFAELREEERVFSAIMSLGNKNEVATTQKIVSSAGIKEK